MKASNEANPYIAVLLGEVLQRAQDRGLVVTVVLEADRGQGDLVTYEAGEKVDAVQIEAILCEARKSAAEILTVLGVTPP